MGPYSIYPIPTKIRMNPPAVTIGGGDCDEKHRLISDKILALKFAMFQIWPKLLSDCLIQESSNFIKKTLCKIKK
jgi:hypothetical protein